MTVSAQFPEAAVSFGQVTETGDGRTLLARNQEALAARSGLLPVSGSTDVTPAGSTVVLTLASGCLRTVSTVGIATGMTLAPQTTGAVQGQRFVIAKTANAATGIVTVDLHGFTTKKKFNCELIFVNGAWRMIGKRQYA